MRSGDRTDLSASRRPSPADEGFLKAIHHLGGAEKTVCTNEIADYLE
ncbi:MAG: hypothetical protein HYX68_11100 [Planctomycetes bacterium]|nr:hypothetical protein [Planctomycetota bacterium]